MTTDRYLAPSAHPADLYPLTVTLARQYECNHLIALGCGDAAQLAALQPEFQIIALESANRLEQCRQDYPAIQWLALEPHADMPAELPFAVLHQAILISAGLNEQQPYPEALLARLQQWLQTARLALLAIATCPPEASAAAPDQLPGAAHWQQRLTQAGMPVAYCGPAKEQPGILAILPGHSLQASHPDAVHDLGNFCAQWLQASTEQRAAAAQLDRHHLELARRQASDSANDSSSNNPGPATPALLLERAIASIQATHYEEAFALLSQALQQEPENADVVFQMGRLAATCNMDEDAKQLFYQAALRKPELLLSIIDIYTQQVQDARAGS